MEEKIGRILFQVEASPFRIRNICCDLNRKTFLIAVFVIVFRSLPIFYVGQNRLCLLLSMYTITTPLCAVSGCTANCETLDCTEREREREREREESLATDYFWWGAGIREKKGIIFRHVIINLCIQRNMSSFNP